MSRAAIGLDLGGTELRAAIVSESGRVLAHAQVKTEAAAGPDVVIAQMAALARHVRAERPDLEILGLGIGAPGPLDADAGIAIAPPTLAGWRDVPLRDRLAEALSMPVVLDNDGHAAALGEWRFGSGAGLRHFVYVTISTGIGGGVVSDGRLVRGRRGLAGHVGHMAIVEDGPVCACGTHGCWEALASGTALGREARRAVTTDPTSRLAALAGTEPANARHVAAAAREGDATALALMAEEGRRLGIGIANLLHLYSPERIVLGGGLTSAFDLFAPAMRATIAARAMPDFRAVPVEPSALGLEVGVVGAAALVLAPDPGRGPVQPVFASASI